MMDKIYRYFLHLNSCWVNRSQKTLTCTQKSSSHLHSFAFISISISSIHVPIIFHSNLLWNVMEIPISIPIYYGITIIQISISIHLPHIYHISPPKSPAHRPTSTKAPDPHRSWRRRVFRRADPDGGGI